MVSILQCSEDVCPEQGGSKTGWKSSWYIRVTVRQGKKHLFYCCKI